MTKIIDTIRREPARAAATILTVIIVVVSLVTHQPVEAIIGEVVAVVALLERVRAIVTPLVKRTEDVLTKEG